MDIQVKVVRKKGFVINPDDNQLSIIVNNLIVNQGHCFTHIKNRNGHDQCPCSEYLQNNKCHCKLYVTKKEIRNEKVKRVFQKIKRVFLKNN